MSKNHHPYSISQDYPITIKRGVDNISLFGHRKMHTNILFYNSVTTYIMFYNKSLYVTIPNLILHHLKKNEFTSYTNIKKQISHKTLLILVD